MGALTQGIRRDYRGASDRFDTPVKLAADVTLFVGGLVMYDNGYAKPCVPTAGAIFAGLVRYEDVNSIGKSDGEIQAVIICPREIFIENDSVDETWIGVKIYATTDNDITTLVGTNNIEIGTGVEVVNAGGPYGKKGLWVRCKYLA